MKPNLITDFSGIHYDVNTWTDFKWVKATRQYDTKGRKSFAKWQWVTVDDLLEFRRKRKSTLIFHSIGHFREQDTETEQLCDLCFECDVSGETDFERRQNFQRMQNTVDEIYRFFADLGISDGQIRFWFTGGRSLHVVVMYQPFGIEPMVELNLVMKHIAQYFNNGLLDGDEYLPLDESLYANPKQFRMPNSYYPKHDAWKIEISPNEFDLPEAKLRKLAKKPRLPLYDLAEISTDPVPDAVEWYQERFREFQELQKEREHIPTDITALKEMEGVPACISELRTNTIAKNDTRNQATLLDATFCKSTGINQSEAFGIINEWVQRIPGALSDCEPGRARSLATKSVIDSVYRGKQYKFACGYAKSLGLKCEKETCPLYQKRDFRKFGKRVKVIKDFQPTVSNEIVSVETVRAGVKSRVRSHAKRTSEAEGQRSADTANEGDILLRTPPGGGKTETSIKTIDCRNVPTIQVEAKNNMIYAASRRDMLDFPMNLISHSPCQLIKPRGPIGHKPGDGVTLESHGETEVSPVRSIAEGDACVLHNALEMMEYEQSALCPNYKHADALAAKRWNVAKWLCAKKCDIGMTACPYWQQFKVVGSCCITHQILFIPNHMESLVSNNEPTVIFDEPNPQTFIEQVNITAKVLTEEIARHKGNPEITEFLELIRDVVEGFERGRLLMLASDSTAHGTYITGSAVIQKLCVGKSDDFQEGLESHGFASAKPVCSTEHLDNGKTREPVQEKPNLEGLSKAERQKVIKDFIKMNVGQSDRTIATELGCGQQTIGRYRKQLEANGEIERIARRKGLDGKNYNSGVPKITKNGTPEIENETPENGENGTLGEPKVNQAEGVATNAEGLVSPKHRGCNRTANDFEKMLDAVMGWMSIDDSYIEIQVDTISTQSTDRAWLVIIDNAEFWIPRSICFESNISDKRLMIPQWFAEKKGFDYDIPDTDKDVPEGDIPLNFLPDLVTILSEEYRKFKRGKDYNSQLALTQTPLGQKILRMNIRKQPRLRECRLILLDAFGDAELLSKLTGRNIVEVNVGAGIDADVVQIVDGYYGITTTWRKRRGGGIPKASLERLIKAAANIASQDPEGTLIVTWKLIHHHIEELQKQGKFDAKVVVDHFGNVKGSNDYQHKRQVIIIGAPSIHPDELLQMAHCIWHDDPEPIDDEMVKDGNWREFQYREHETGNGYAVEVREYKDKRLNLLLKFYREYEIAQDAHRIRPLLYPGERKIWLLTNLPIDELPPTYITDLDDIIAETDPEFLQFVEIVKDIVTEFGGIWGNLLDLTKGENMSNFLLSNACNRRRVLLATLESKKYTRATIFNQLHRAVKILGYESAIVTISTGKRGPINLKVWHAGNLDAGKIRELYHQSACDSHRCECTRQEV